LFADYGYVAAKALGEALKMTDGDATNKDKLAEAMTKVKFNAPRGPFRMDPATHNPIQDIYICQVIDSGSGISTKILSTAKDVQDPGKKLD
jgi:branched-chain amino acid transport system substrate-binding protein